MSLIARDIRHEWLVYGANKALWQGGVSTQLQVSAWGKNIFDEEYRENTIPFRLWTISYWGAPATYGVDAKISFYRLD